MNQYFMVDLADDEVHTEPHVGLKFRNLNNLNVYYDDVHRGYVSSYRYTFFSYARFKLYEQKDSVGAGRVLNRMNQLISVEQFPISMMFEMEIGRLYNAIGMYAESEKVGMNALKSCEMIIKNPRLYTLEQGFQVQPGSTDEEALNQASALARMYAAEAAKIAGKWDVALRYLKEFGSMTGRSMDLEVKIDEIEVLKKLRAKDFYGALDGALRMRGKYGNIGSEMQQLIFELQRRLGREQQQLSMAVTP
jgi:hypothetical protein